MYKSNRKTATQINKRQKISNQSGITVQIPSNVVNKSTDECRIGTDMVYGPEQVYITPEYVRYEKQRNIKHKPEQTIIDMMR